MGSWAVLELEQGCCPSRDDFHQKNNLLQLLADLWLSQNLLRYFYTHATKCWSLFQAWGSRKIEQWKKVLLLGWKTALFQRAHEVTIHNHRGQMKKIQLPLESRSLTDENKLPLVFWQEDPCVEVIKWLWFLLFILIDQEEWCCCLHTSITSKII